MSKEEVYQASSQFYAALNSMLNGDARPLSDIWSHGSDVTTMHPIGGREVGWGEVRRSWEEVAQVSSEGKVELKEQLIQVVGDIAYEVGVEQAQLKLAGRQVRGEARVTNIYQRVGGTWKITHHHTDPVPAMLEVLESLQQ